jgi:hypothetical protein
LCSDGCSDAGTENLQNPRENLEQAMSSNPCITVRRPAWLLAETKVVRYRRARRYSPLAHGVLQFVAFHRTATAQQIYRHDPQLFGMTRSGRSMRMHLQTLAAAGDLQVVRGPVNTPNVYLITGQGLRNAGNGNMELVPARRRRPSGSHLPHELLITEIAVLLNEVVWKLPSFTVPWQERFGFRRHLCFGGLVPDYAFVIKHTGGLSVCFVEVSSGEESTTRFREKLTAYQLWSDTDVAQQFLIELYRTHGASQPRPQFRLLCVMHSRLGQNDDARLLQLVDAAAGIDTDMRRRLWCTTAELVGKSKDLAGPIWLRLGELESAFIESGPRRRRALREKLVTANRHSLLPTEAAT